MSRTKTLFWPLGSPRWRPSRSLGTGMTFSTEQARRRRAIASLSVPAWFRAVVGGSSSCSLP